MRTNCIAATALGLVVAVVGAAAPAPPKEQAKEPVVPDEVFRDIVKEANQYIQESLDKARKSPPKSGEAGSYYGKARANTLLIALAAQNRMNDPDADAKQLATLRDTAVNFADAVKAAPPDLGQVQRLADLLNQYPKLKADPNARTDRVRLKDTFTHDTITFLFGGCSGKSGHAIQSDLLALAKKRLPYSDDDENKIERLAYKVALLTALAKEFDVEHTPPKKPGLQKEWVRMAGEVETASWTLAEAAKVADHDDIKKKLSVIYSTCASCHVVFVP